MFFHVNTHAKLIALLSALNPLLCSPYTSYMLFTLRIPCRLSHCDRLFSLKVQFLRLLQHPGKRMLLPPLAHWHVLPLFALQLLFTSLLISSLHPSLIFLQPLALQRPHPLQISLPSVELWSPNLHSFWYC